MPPFMSQTTFWVFVIAVCFILFLLFGFNWEGSWQRIR